jgi:hypothetical protein
VFGIKFVKNPIKNHSVTPLEKYFYPPCIAITLLTLSFIYIFCQTHFIALNVRAYKKKARKEEKKARKEEKKARKREKRYKSSHSADENVFFHSRSCKEKNNVLFLCRFCQSVLIQSGSKFKSFLVMGRKVSVRSEILRKKMRSH